MNWQFWVSVVAAILSVLCKLGVRYLEGQNKVDEVQQNREMRRHPDGRIPAQKFKRVNAKGRQKQGRGRVVKGW